MASLVRDLAVFFVKLRGHVDRLLQVCAVLRGTLVRGKVEIELRR